jgi:uncharacterized Zn finger protein (UPF0148 family)
MDCPRCGTPLTRISLNGELQSVYCERCRFADIESDHTRVSAVGETWDDALRRFRTANADGSGESGESVDVDPKSDGAEGGETDRDGEQSADADGSPVESDGADAAAEASESESDRPADGAETEEA